MNSSQNFYNQYETLINKALNENYTEKEIYNTIYRIEFENYLRKGFEPRLKELNIVMGFVRQQIVEKAVKSYYFETNYQQKQTTNSDEFAGQKYIWRTENDSKVRSRHAERNGKTYIWGEDLNPGEDYGCRCRAEFVDEEGNKIGLGRVKYDDNGEPFLNELKDKEKGLWVLNENTRYGKNPITGKIDSNIPKRSDKSIGYCGQYTAEAIRSAGFKDLGYPKDRLAKNYGEPLEDVGFEKIDSENSGTLPEKYSPRTGDVMIFESYPGQESQAGHMQMFDGEKWISDFVQKTPWPGNGYLNDKTLYTIYRSNDW